MPIIPVLYGDCPPASEAGGPAFESRPGHHLSRGLSRPFRSRPVGWGRIGPFGDAEIREGEVQLFLAEGVSINPKGKRRVRMAQLIGYPSDGFAGLQCQGRPRMSRAVQPQGAHSLILRPASNSVPGSLQVARVLRRAVLAREHPLGDLGPSPLQGFASSVFEEDLEICKSFLGDRDATRARA